MSSTHVMKVEIGVCMCVYVFWMNIYSHGRSDQYMLNGTSKTKDAQSLLYKCHQKKVILSTSDFKNVVILNLNTIYQERIQTEEL